MPSRNPNPTGVIFSTGSVEPRPTGSAPAQAAASTSVDWLPWDTAAFARAQRDHRPILLCLVTSWSAACQRLEATLSGAPGLPRAVRERVVAVRVDADRRPDIAERYTQGGWPTLLLLTPEGELLADALARSNDPGAMADAADEAVDEGSHHAGHDAEGDGVAVAVAQAARLVTRVAARIDAAADALRGHRRELALRAEAWRRERTAVIDERTAPGDTAPGDTAPGDTAPGDTAPGDTTPGDTTPGGTAAGGGARSRNASAGELLSRETVEDRLAHIAARLLSTFDARHGGFCIGGVDEEVEKFPHAAPIAFALWQGVRTSDARLVEAGLTTLERMASGALSAPDGAFHRCCHAADWSAPDEAVLLETQAELIPLYLDGWTIGGGELLRERALGCLAFVERVLEDEARGGFFASRAADGRVERVLATDANAKMVSALVRAGRVLEAPRLVERAARALERLLPVVYQRGAGVAHLLLPGARAAGEELAQNGVQDRAQHRIQDQAHVRGLLRDQIEMSAALLDAGLAAGEPVYLELAEELMRSTRRRFAHASGLLTDRVRTAAGAGDVGLLADPLCPVTTNATAARVLLRLGRDADRPDLLSAAHTLLSILSSSSHSDHPIVVADLGLALLESLESPA